MHKQVIIYLDNKCDLENAITAQLNDVFTDYKIETHYDKKQAIDLINNLKNSGKDIPLVFIGEKLFNLYGEIFFYEIKKLLTLTNIILLSSENAIKTIPQKLKNIGLHDYLTKNFLNNNMMTTVTQAIKNYTMNSQIEKSYKVDSLTKLYNRNELINNINSSKNPTIILVNIDDFRFINATHGYTNGDLILKKLATLFKTKFGDNNVFRLISDEFIFFYENISMPDALEFANNLKSVIQNEEFIINDKTKVNLTVSIAISDKKENIIEDAQNAINESIKHCKNSVCIAKEVKQENEILFTLNNLQLALDDDKIFPFYQGIRDNKTGLIDKYECLVRLKNNEDEIVSPRDFLNLAQSVGLLPEITKIVISKAFDNFKDKDFIFSINISEDDLKKNYLVDFIKKQSEIYNINLNRVVLEILENIQLESTSNIYKQISDLKELGCKIAFDDFGSEKSNFSRLLDLQIDIVKIDSMFIKNIHKDQKSYKLARAITNLAKDFDCKVVAEGVECYEAQRIVEELSIDYTQGFYYSKPQQLI